MALIRLRGQLKVQCAQKIFDCIVSDAVLLDALGASKALAHIKGEPPTDLVTLISQGPGRHIQTHAYTYERSITREIVIINRVKDLQVSGYSEASEVQVNPPAHLATRPPGHLATRPPGHPATRPRHLATRPPGHPATRPPGHPATRPPGHLATWPPGHLATRPPGHPPPGHLATHHAAIRP